MNVSKGDVHLWLTFYDEITEELLHSTYRELLNSAEQKQEARFFFASDRRRYLITRALVRTVLSRYVPIQPSDWIFSTSAYGRPEIVNPEAREACLSFNISHTEGLIVLGVTRRRPLGVDVERLQGRDVPMEIADHYFAPAEVAVLATSPPDQQKYRFFEYWTFKEAYIKARGMGLSLPLDKFSFHYPDDRRVEIAIDPELCDDSRGWQFWQFRPRPEYLMAICAGRAEDESMSLVVRQAVPMGCESKFPVQLLRASNHVAPPHARERRVQ